MGPGSIKRSRQELQRQVWGLDLQGCYFLCRNVTLTGPVRIQFRPLFSRPPIVGAVKVSFIEQPSFTYNVSLARVSVTSWTLHAELWKPASASQSCSGGCKL